MYIKLLVHVVPLDGYEIYARILRKNPSFLFIPLSPSPPSSPFPSFLSALSAPKPTPSSSIVLHHHPKVVLLPPAVSTAAHRNRTKTHRHSLETTSFTGNPAATCRKPRQTLLETMLNLTGARMEHRGAGRGEREGREMDAEKERHESQRDPMVGEMHGGPCACGKVLFGSLLRNVFCIRAFTISSRSYLDSQTPSLFTMMLIPLRTRNCTLDTWNMCACAL